MSTADWDEQSTIHAHVLEHFICGDVGNGSASLTYENVLFSIRILVENLEYTVDRSYVDFVELDRRLKKQYPRTALQPLPLDATEPLQKLLTVHEKDVKKRQLGKELSLMYSRDVLLGNTEPLYNGPDSSNPYRIRERLNEDFHGKVNALDNYLVTLLTLHELVSSDEILLFFDEEASSMSVDPASLEPLSEHDILLLNEPINRCTVRRSEERAFEITSGQMILWKFCTLDFDIGFSVELNGETKVPYTRYKSHEKVISGIFEPQMAHTNARALCVLKWDNSYAKLRSKQLSWIACVVRVEDYLTAKQQAFDIQREKKKFEDQRHALRRCAVHHASLLSGVIQNASVVSSYAQEEKKQIKELEEDCYALRNTIKQYQIDLENAQITFDSLEKEIEELGQSKQLMTNSWQYSLKEIEGLKQENRLLHDELQEDKLAIHELKMGKYHLEEKLTQAQRQLQSHEYQQVEVMEACKAALEHADEELVQVKTEYELQIHELAAQHSQAIAAAKQETERKMKLLYEQQIHSLNAYIDALHHQLESQPVVTQPAAVSDESLPPTAAVEEAIPPQASLELSLSLDEFERERQLSSEDMARLRTMDEDEMSTEELKQYLRQLQKDNNILKLQRYDYEQELKDAHKQIESFLSSPSPSAGVSPVKPPMDSSQRVSPVLSSLEALTLATDESVGDNETVDGEAAGQQQQEEEEEY